MSKNSPTAPSSCPDGPMSAGSCGDWPCLSSGRGDVEKMRQMEEKINFLTKNLHDVQSTLRILNNRFQQEVIRPGGGGGEGSVGGGGAGGSSGGRNPADAAQPEIKETINSIQTKLDQLDNRTMAS